MRGAALGIDLICLAGGPLLLATALVFGILLVTPDPPVSLASGFRGAQILFVALFLLRDSSGGARSPGKALFGVRVVRRDGRPCGVVDSVVRNIPVLFPGWNLIEAISVFRRPDTRRPGDRAAGTLVVEA